MIEDFLSSTDINAEEMIGWAQWIEHTSHTRIDDEAHDANVVI